MVALLWAASRAAAQLASALDRAAAKAHHRACLRWFAANGPRDVAQFAAFAERAGLTPGHALALAREWALDHQPSQGANS